MLRKIMKFAWAPIAAILLCSASWMFVPTPASSFTNTKSLTLVDADDHMTVPHASAINFDGTGAFSVSTWFYQTSTGNGDRFMGKGTDTTNLWELTLAGTTRRIAGYFMVTYGVDHLDFVTAISQFSGSTWYHLLWTYDGSKTNAGIKWYLNGSNVAQALIDGTSPITGTIGSTDDLWIGDSASAFATQFVGQLDEVSIYNSELSSSDATALYNGGDPKNISTLSSYSSCVAWWRFEDNTDDSKGTNDGTLNSNAGYSSNVP